ncbi:MAG TPA: cobalamin-dependent protein [Steroidobacteraceae bacterium]|nr:cobalamin-dependent protein [Steroidobacteraceae bacterium]
MKTEASEAPGLGGSADAMAQLLRTIEGEIIPRLLLAHQSSPDKDATEGGANARSESEDVVEFARLIVAHDIGVAQSFIQAMLSRGVSLERIYLELLAPAARQLGEWWKQDQRDFTQVTIGLGRLHQLLRELSPAFLSDAERAPEGQRILLAPLPGEQHTFGLIMVGEFFRRAGWEVWDAYPATAAELLGMVSAQRCSVIGLSLSCGSRLEELPSLIRDIRAASCNPAARLMVGGLPFIERPELVNTVGADATASDGLRAAREGAKLMSHLANRV